MYSLFQCILPQTMCSCCGTLHFLELFTYYLLHFTYLHFLSYQKDLEHPLKDSIEEISQETKVVQDLHELMLIHVYPSEVYNPVIGV